jgi:hypothetical protein
VGQEWGNQVPQDLNPNDGMPRVQLGRAGSGHGTAFRTIPEAEPLMRLNLGQILLIAENLRCSRTADTEGFE